MNGGAQPARMTAAYIRARGPAENIRVGALPVPAPAERELLVAVDAVAVNMVDTFVRSGAYPTPMAFPFVVGRDLVGRVSAAGENVRGFAVGDAVWCNSLGHGGRQGATAEFAIAAADRAYPLTRGMDAVTTVAMAHPAATAHLALFTHGELRPGETVCIAGAAGNVGRAATVLAADAGARVVACARPEDADSLIAAGASTVIDYRETNLAERIRSVAVAGVDVWLDTSGRQPLGVAIDVLADRGRIVLMAGVTRREELPFGALYTRDRRILGFAISNAAVHELAAAARTIAPLIASSRLTPRHLEILGIEDAARAHRRLEARQAHGSRIILVPKSSPLRARADAGSPGSGTRTGS